MATTFYHAAIPGGPSGLSFQIGDATVFCPVEDHRLSLVEPQALLVAGPVPEAMARFLEATLIAPRLERLAQDLQEVAPCR